MIDKCNVCGGILREAYREAPDPLTAETFSVMACAECGLGHTLPQPAELGPYYAAKYYGNRHGSSLDYCNRRRLRFVAASGAGGGAGKRLLDIGCGDGSFLLAAREAGWQVTGTELNPEPARAAGLDVLTGVEQIAEDGSFDCITMWHTLEHMRDIRFMLAQVARLLKRDGTVIIAVPDWGGLQARLFRQRWLHLDVPRHLYHFDSRSLQRAVQGAELSVQQRWHQEFEYDLLGWSQSALNYLMPTPNVFFDALTGKRDRTRPCTTVAGYLLGLPLTALLLPALWAGTALKKGGSLIVAARHAGSVTGGAEQ